MKDHEKDVKHVYRHLPLTSLHQQAWAAAEALEAAGEQGKFWEMEEKITANVSKLSPAFLNQAAIDVGLDFARFDAAMKDHRYSPRIQADVNEAQRLGINSTPTFVINGTMYSGAPTYEQLDAVVKDAQQR